MKNTLAVFSVLVFALLSYVPVRGYYKPSSGSYVAPSYRTSPNYTKFDNFSTRGNTNPFTGTRGYKRGY